MTEDDFPADDAADHDDSAEAALTAFSAFVRATQSGESPGSGREGLLSMADASRYLNVSTTTVRKLALGGKIRSTRIGDRLRFRRDWLDEFIDAGGGDVPPLLPCELPPPPLDRQDRPAVVVRRPRLGPPPKPPTYIQRIGDQDLRLLSDGGSGRFKRLHTWHVGDRQALCGHQARWTGKTERWPHAFLCATCLTALGTLPGVDLSRFGVRRVAMLRLTQLGSTATAIRSGYHVGTGRRTLCGKTDGPWSLTERFPRTRQCFTCEHRQRWEARNDDPNQLSPRPLSPFRVLVDTGPVNPRLRTLLETHPSSLDARQARDPFTEHMQWEIKVILAAHAAGDPLNAFAGYPSYLGRPPDGGLLYTISDRDGVAFATSAVALDRLPEEAEAIERALALYARWAREERPSKPRHPKLIGRSDGRMLGR